MYNKTKGGENMLTQCRLFNSIVKIDKEKTKQCQALCNEAYEIYPEKPTTKPLIYDIVQ